MAIGERLRTARESLGLTGREVKARTGIGESSLSDFELGKREPRLSQLQRLAGLYHRSLAFFLEEHPVLRPAVLWREPPSENKAELEARFLLLCEQYHNLEEWCGERPHVALPAARGDSAAFGYRDAEELARRVRRELELGDRPGPVLLRVLEEGCGVKVFHLAFSSQGSAAATVGETFGPAVLLNARTAPWRRTFDLAHELFHVLTWAVFRAGRGPEDTCCQKADEEKLAGCFARNLLLPDEAVKAALHPRMKDGQVSYSALVDVAREFEVSVDALLWKVHDLWRGKADEARTREDIVRARAVEAILEPRQRAPEPPVWPDRYFALAVEALRRGLISTGRFAEYVDMSRQEAMRYADQELPYDEEVQIGRL